MSFNIYKNEIVGVVGESGSGKTTLGRLMINLLKPDKGEIFIQNQNVTNLSNKAFLPFRNKIQMVFQDPLSSLNPSLNVYDHLLEAVRLTGLKQKEESDKRVKELLEQVHLPLDKLNAYPHQLSGGECRRVGLARIIALKPEILILDEPVASLDQTIKHTIIDLLLEIKEKRGLTFIWISHDLEIVSQIADRILVMYRGKLVESFSPKELKNTTFLHPYTENLLSAAE